MQNKKIIIKDSKNTFVNPSIEIVIEHIIKNNEGVLGLNGATMVDTGVFTGRSPKDKYFVEEKFSKDNLWWGPVNKKISLSVFDKLYKKVIEYYNNDDGNTYVFNGFAGADEKHKLAVRVYAKKAWQYHFCRNMFINTDLKNTPNFSPDFTFPFVFQFFASINSSSASSIGNFFICAKYKDSPPSPERAGRL